MKSPIFIFHHTRLLHQFKQSRKIKPTFPQLIKFRTIGERKKEQLLKIRPYQHETDFDRISQFLNQNYLPGDVFTPWLQPRWEYLHYHPSILSLDRTLFGVAEEKGTIRGIVHFESSHAEVFIQTHPDDSPLKEVLLNYAERNNFQSLSNSTGRMIRSVYVNDFDHEFESIIASRGYEKWVDFVEENSRYLLDDDIPTAKLPSGFAIQSLEDENDLHKINRVLWRGFNHEGPPPEEEFEGRFFGQKAPNFRKDLTMVAVAPDESFVSYCGMWYVPQHQLAYLEPLATDPDFRRIGLGKAVVYESLRRVKALGAKIVWVGSGQEFYKAIGFQQMFSVYPWVKFID
jgi:predicted N-acetyltransferase YhbS